MPLTRPLYRPEAIPQGKYAALTDQPDGTIRGTDLDYVNTPEIGHALADTDEILISDGGGNTARRKSALSRVWAYIESKLGAVTSITAGGAWNFSSTTRPTTAGTGTPAGNSLVSLSDMAQADLHYRHASVSRVIRAISPLALAGSVGQTLTDGLTQLSITAANTFSGYSWGALQPHSGFSGFAMSFSRPFIASATFYIRALADSATSNLRFFIGNPVSYNPALNALSSAGLCVEIARSGTVVQARLAYFSGSYLTTSWVTIASYSGVINFTFTLVIRNNGAGTVDVFITSNNEASGIGVSTKPIPNLNGAPLITVSNAPTTAPSGLVSILAASLGTTVADVPIANTQARVGNFSLEFTA